MKKVSGNIVDVMNRRIYKGTVEFDSKIRSIAEVPSTSEEHYIMPGFIDAHVHIESSMLVPSEFARAASRFGTVATVSDPHEIANVLGLEGIKFMIDNAEKVPFKIYFGASSCVPATAFETAGAEFGVSEIETLFDEYGMKYLSEMMNYPGVIFDDAEVLAKIKAARDRGLPVDGHAPGLRGEKAEKYATAGISTDHECFTYEEALEKVKLGMKILIREGSAAKNFEALHKLISEYPDMCMFCSDDKHPDDLIKGHINELASRAIALGHDLFDVLKAACTNATSHYKLDIGQLAEGDSADFIIVEDLKDFSAKAVYSEGELVAEGGKTLIESVPVTPINRFNAELKTPADFRIPSETDNVRVIKAIDGELITEELIAKANLAGGAIMPDVSRDILKIAIIDRYNNGTPSVALISGFGLKKGAIASSVAHDSHNIIAVGIDDESLCEAVNEIVRNKGGIAVFDGSETRSLALPVAGLMATEDAYEVADEYIQLDKAAKELGSPLNAPFMTLSFMALLVIPSLKLSDKGLFDGNKFEFTNLQAKI